MASFLRNVRFGRRPISHRRRALGLAGLVVLLGLIVGYRYVTRAERVRVFAEAYLRNMTGGIVQIQAARFDLFEGLHLTNVRVATQPDASFNPQHGSYEDRVIFNSQDLYLKLRPFSLITGDLIVPEIVAFEPKLRLLKDPESGARNWEFLSHAQTRPGRPAEKKPTVRLRSAVVDLAWTKPTAGRVAMSMALDVTAEGTTGSLYDIRWRTRTEPIENGRFVLDMSTLHLRTAEGGLPTIPVASVRWAAPVELERWMELLDLRGQVRTDSLSYDPAKGSSAQLTLHNASLAVPANEQDRATPREQRYLSFTGVEGQLVFRGSAVEISLSGRWRGGTCSLKGRISANVATMRSFDDLGFDISIEGRHILLPSLPDERTPAEERFIAQWPKLVDFCEFYSPTGHIDADFSLAKKAGRGEPLEFRGGTMVARGAGAAFIGFPYQLENLNGVVHFLPDGRVWLDTLVGTHGSARVTVDGMLTSATWACGVDLSIEGLGVELDESLHACLSATYRAVWDTFDPKGCVNARVAMHRAPGVEKITKPWDTNVSADLLGISACYEGLPLEMTDVRGRIQITPDEFFVPDVRGRYRGAAWSLAGIVATPPGRPPDASLRVKAAGLPIDDELAGALPPSGGALLATLQPHGEADIDGTVSTGSDSSLEYDLAAHVSLSSVCSEAAGLALTDVDAALHILPRQIEVEHAAGAYESGIVAMEGVVPLTENADPMWLRVLAHHTPLTGSVFAALPQKAQRAWEALRPAGHIDADLRMWKASTDAGSELEAEVEITPRGLAISPADFPLTVSDITGTVRASSHDLQIVDAAGAIGDGRISVDGGVAWNNDDIAGELRVQTAGMSFSDAIRRALPWRARRAWDSTQPTGKFDLLLRRLAFDQAGEGPKRWTFDGRAVLHGVDFGSNGALRGMAGTIDARGTMAGGGTGVGIDGTIDLKRMRFGERAATNVRATVTKRPTDTLLQLADLRADIYGGLLSGFAELQFKPNRMTYGFSAVVRDVSLPAFIDAGRSPDAKPIRAQGMLSGTLFLNGAVGEKQARRGGGTVRIEHAQIAKIPLLLAILGAINLAPPDENAFHEGTAEFTLQEDALMLGPIDLRGTSVSLVGAGKMNTATQQLDLTLLAGPPHRLPRLGLLTELAEGAARELMEVRVQGSLYEPKIEAQPLRSLRQALEAIGQLRQHPRETRLSHE